MSKSIDLDTLVLTNGAHDANNADVCMLEAISLIAGEPKSDHPQCVYPPFASAGRSLNDGPWDSDTARTDHLKKYIPMIMGTSDYVNNPKIAKAVAQAAAKCAREFADGFDATLTPGARLARNAPILMDALLQAANDAK